MQLIWQFEGNNPDNPDNFAKIKDWWQETGYQEISWQQRVIPDDGDINKIDWENQRFDEDISLQAAEIRGITLYWHQSGRTDERSITPRQLVLDPFYQTLDVYPQSQPQLIIRLARQVIVYDRINLSNPLIAGTTVDGHYILLLRDKKQQLEVKVSLNQDSLRQFLNNLPNN